MESVVTIQPPFCGYNTMQCVELNGEDLSCHSNKLNRLVEENVRMITDLPTERI